jgi:hypothetical protein
MRLWRMHGRLDVEQSQRPAKGVPKSPVPAVRNATRPASLIPRLASAPHSVADSAAPNQRPRPSCSPFRGGRERSCKHGRKERASGGMVAHSSVIGADSERQHRSLRGSRHVVPLNCRFPIAIRVPPYPTEASSNYFRIPPSLTGSITTNVDVLATWGRLLIFSPRTVR